MKKQFSILIATFITVAFISCSKEKIEVTDTPSGNKEEIATSNSSNRPILHPTTQFLEGRFEFNSNLKDVSKQLADAVPSTRVVKYTKDRNGVSNAAIYLDSTYGLKIKDVPQKTNTSMSIWIMPANIKSNGCAYVVGPDAYGPNITQVSNLISSGVVMNVTIPGGEAEYINNTNWRHLVVTYDGLDVKGYLNGNLVFTNNEPGFIPASLTNFFIGNKPGAPRWKGAVDDLRFYSCTLSAADVQYLYNQ